MRTRELQTISVTRSPWTPVTARRVLDEWRRSGQTLTAFARELGCTVQRLSWWRQRLDGAVDETPKPAAAVTFVPATIVETTSARSLVVRVGNHIEVEARTAGDVPPAWVAALVRELARTA